MSDIARFQKDVGRFTTLASKRRAEMIAACEAYAQTEVCLALAHERLERAKEKEQGE